MKRILFVGQSLKIGGVEKALVEQANALVGEKYDIDIFLFYKGGEYLQYLSPKVRVFGGNLLLSCMAMTNKEAKRNPPFFILRTVMYLLSRVVGNKRLYSMLFSLMKGRTGYDVAVSYFHDGGEIGLYYGCNLYVLKKVKAIRKIAWIHSDPSILMANSPSNMDLYRCFDMTVNVSKAMKDSFDRLAIVPGNQSKVVYNRFNPEEIVRLAKDYTVITERKGATMVTVGRLESLKSTLELLDIAKRLKDDGCVFYWKFIGTGCLFNEAKDYIRNMQLVEYVELTGQLINPYPHVANADILVSGSKTETFGLSILEALVLHTPVIAYRYKAIDEVLKNSVNGIVADSFEELYQQLHLLLSKTELIKELQAKSSPLFEYNEINYKQVEVLL